MQLLHRSKVREKLRRQKMLEQQKQEKPQITKQHRKVYYIILNNVHLYIITYYLDGGY